MKIYTKTGDKGTTSLLGGTRVSKADQKLEAYGTVDELNSILGIIAASREEHTKFINSIQHRLFNIGSLLALEREVNFEMPTLENSDIEMLEVEIDRMNESLTKLSNFILPGGSVLAGHTHLARTVCRRAERRVVALNDDQYGMVVQYLNRLSDYLFVLSRDFLRLEGQPEIHWKP